MTMASCHTCQILIGLLDQGQKDASLPDRSSYRMHYTFQNLSKSAANGCSTCILLCNISSISIYHPDTRVDAIQISLSRKWDYWYSSRHLSKKDNIPSRKHSFLRLDIRRGLSPFIVEFSSKHLHFFLSDSIAIF